MKGVVLFLMNVLKVFGRLLSKKRRRNEREELPEDRYPLF